MIMKERNVAMPKFNKIQFRDYDDPSCAFPVKIITPDDGYYIHTFFDTDPISPSGRYVAVLKIPFQDQIPTSEDLAQVCIIDRVNEQIAEIFSTNAWGTQVGAHISWGKDDSQLFFNNRKDDNIYAVEYNTLTDTYTEHTGSVYMPSRDGRYLFSPNLATISYSQEGYGATMPKGYSIEPNESDYATDGLWRCDTATGEKKLILSIQEAIDTIADKRAFVGGKFVFFHTKVNKSNCRIMQVVRYVFPDMRRLCFILTCDFDGGNIKVALPYEMWLSSSHHPDWHPNSTDILMNFQMQDMRFGLFGEDFTNFRIIAQKHHGGGHPSISPSQKYLITDAYTAESEFVDSDNRVALRLINLENSELTNLCYIWTLGGLGLHPSFRCDPHPAFSQNGNEISFNGAPFGKKAVLIADISSLC